MVKIEKMEDKELTELAESLHSDIITETGDMRSLINLSLEVKKEQMKRENEKEPRIKKLEEIAHNNMSGEEIGMQLDAVDPKLRKEYEKLMYDWND